MQPHDAAAATAADDVTTNDAATNDTATNDDGELRLVETDGGRSFPTFYATARDGVARALALTLGDVDLAVDSVDEAMVRAFQRWDRVGRLDNPAGWVYRVALNHARSRLRRIARRRPPERTPDAEVPPVEPAVTRALAELSVDHRSVVVCRLLLGWSELDTADALRIKPGTVKSRLHRALAQLEERLDHLRPEEDR